MAGESPGKSEQQKSSGETARGDRDPRLAVFREGEAAGGASAVAVASEDSEADPEPTPDEPGAPAKDRATAVFRTVRGESPGEPEAESEADAEAEPEGAEGPEGPDAAGDGEASGVRDGEPSEAAEASYAKSGPEAEPETGETVSSLPTRPTAEASAASSSKADKKADNKADNKANKKNDKGDTAKADEADKESEADKASGSADEEASPESRDARLRQAVAAWVAGADADADSGAETDAGAEESDADASDDKASAPSIDQRTAVFRALKTTPAKDETDGGTEGDSKADSKAGPEEDSEPEPKGGSEADDEAADTPIDRPTAAFGVLPEKSARKGDDTEKADGTDKVDEKRVDQPTRAIKAISAPADTKASDTKASDTKASGTETSGDKASGKKRSDSESDNERTSKFVPLRSADAPPAKPSAPPAQPSAPPALPEAERTKQQPLPPPAPDGKQPAPLDLLAQLTNTPPKPETPIRTMVRRVKIWTPLVVLLVLVLGVIQALRPLPEPSLQLTADDTFSFSGGKLSMPWPDQGQSAAEVEGVGSLGTSGEQKPVPIASVTKVMTAYVVLKGHPLKADAKGPSITIDAQAGKEAQSQDESRVPVKEGQKFTERQMLELLLIPSGNNIARQLARWDAGSLEAFVKKMNDAAKDLGMKNTTYTDPSGLKSTTKSTAEDQLKLARAAMRSEAFRAVVATPNIQIPGLKDRIYNNNNLLVKPGVVGIKTGSSTPAGGALMWAAEKTVEGKKQRILGVMLEQRSGGTLDESLQLVQTNSYKLITTLQNGLTSARVVKKGDVVGQVDDGLGGTTPVVATKDLTAVGWSGLTVDIKLTDGGKTVPHSAKAGTVVGELTVGTGPGQLKAPVALQEDLSEPSFGSKLTRIA